MIIISDSVNMLLGGKEILKKINLTISEREFVGIIGPNGSGKTTLLKCIYRVQKPTAGKIYFNGTYIDEFSYRETAQRLAVVAQHNFYNFDFSVLEVVLMGRSPHKKILEPDNELDYMIAHRALQQVELEGFETRKFSTLSGGEQQRVILARALTQETECLVLDEPINHLDIKYQLQLMDIVKSLGRTIISAIHDLNIAAMYCDRIIALKEGEIVAEGEPKKVFTEKFILDTYGVRSQVSYNSKNDRVNIVYLPQYETKSVK